MPIVIDDDDEEGKPTKLTQRSKNEWFFLLEQEMAMNCVIKFIGSLKLGLRSGTDYELVCFNINLLKISFTLFI